MGDEIAKLELELVFSEQAESALLNASLAERRRIKRAIELNAEPLLKQYRMARRRVPHEFVGSAFQQWVFVKLDDHAALVNQFGTEIRVHVVYRKEEHESWRYLQWIYRVLRKRGRGRATRIVELTLKRPNVLAHLRVYFIRGCQVRYWSVPLIGQSY